MKRLLIAVVVLAAVGAGGLYFWARAVLGGDAVRAGVEAQLQETLGQPVTVAAATAGIWPRVTLTLRDVVIGKPARITVSRLHLGTSLGALLSRRIEGAAVALDGARVELPLPAVTLSSSAPGGSATDLEPPVEIVSIDSVEFRNVEIVSGGRTIRGDVDVVPQSRGLLVRRVHLTADDTSFEITGNIEDLAGPIGELSVKARGLNALDLLAFVRDFSAGSGFVGSGPAGAASSDVPMDLRVAIDAGRATVGTLGLDSLIARARITPRSVALEQADFSVFGGSYSGSLSWTLAATPAYSLKAALRSLDVAQAMTFAGSPGSVTGTLNGSISVSGRGTSATDVVQSARGAARLEVSNGTVTGLGLVRAIILATAMRAGGPKTPAGDPRTPEPFSSITATFAIGDGLARTTDLEFESKDVSLASVGTLELLPQTVDLSGDVKLSEDLSRQAGPDLVRYTAEQGRVTLPIDIRGRPGSFTVTPNVADLTKRAITNKAQDSLKGLLKRVIK